MRTPSDIQAETKKAKADEAKDMLRGLDDPEINAAVEKMSPALAQQTYTAIANPQAYAGKQLPARLRGVLGKSFQKLGITEDVIAETVVRLLNAKTTNYVPVRSYNKEGKVVKETIKVYESEDNRTQAMVLKTLLHLGDYFPAKTSHVKTERVPSHPVLAEFSQMSDEQLVEMANMKNAQPTECEVENAVN